MADADLLARQPREGGVGEVGVGELLQHLARTRARQHQHAVAGGDGGQRHRAVGGRELAQHVMVVAFERACGDEIECARRILVDGELAEHAAARREEVGERDAAARLGHAVGEDAFKPRARARPRHLHLGERRHVLKADVLHHVAAFGADEVEIVGTAERPLLLDPAVLRRRGVVVVGQNVGRCEILRRQAVSGGREPARALVAVDRAEHRPQRLHALMAGRALERPGGGALLVRVVRGEDVGVGFLVLHLEVAARGVRPEAARIDAHHVDGGHALDDPFGELPASAARRRHAERVALVEPEVLHIPRRADDRRAVRRVGDGAVVHLLDAGLAERRHARDGGFDVRGEAVEIFLEQLVLAVLRRAVDVAARRALLVGAEKQAAVLLAHVPRGVALAQHAHLRQPLPPALDDQGVRLGDDVLVLDGDDGDIEAHHLAGLAGEVAGGRDDMLARDIALVGLHQPFAGGLPLDAGDGGVAVDRGAAVTRALRQRLGEIGGLDVAVFGVLDRAEDAAGLAQRPNLLQLLRGEDVQRHADGFGDAGVIHELVPAVLRAGEADVGDVGEADVEAGLLLELLIEAHRVLVDLPNRVGEVEQRQKARRVPGGAGGELLPLDQHAVAPALPRQVIERRNAHHAAADHHHARLSLHRRPSRTAVL